VDKVKNDQFWTYVVTYKFTILNYCMVSINILLIFSSAEQLLDNNR